MLVEMHREQGCVGVIPCKNYTIKDYCFTIAARRSQITPISTRPLQKPMSVKWITNEFKEYYLFIIRVENNGGFSTF